MILKDKTIIYAVSPTAKAGQKQEQDVAFFLRRAFKDHKKVFVINDFKFSHNDETAQIDHLIIYPYGFVLVESKSIKGNVKVNDFEEWTRSLGSQWSGMPSPIKQVELQQKLLRELLYENRENILNKLLGIKQQTFGMRCWDNVCAISSHAIIDRETMPKNVSKYLVKTEFLVDKLKDIMKLKDSVVKKLNPFETRPDFSDDELLSITSFLMSQVKQTASIPEKITEPLKPYVQASNSVPVSIACKNCHERSDYLVKSGRYGYFIKCNKCDTNTPLKTPCLSCTSKNTKVSKKQTTYTLQCCDCESSTVLIQ
tara:strand:- start:312 stop:1247 length:936 start_codon:yes stop_codon:yes gene_type:complete